MTHEYRRNVKSIIVRCCFISVRIGTLSLASPSSSRKVVKKENACSYFRAHSFGVFTDGVKHCADAQFPSDHKIVKHAIWHLRAAPRTWKHSRCLRRAADRSAAGRKRSGQSFVQPLTFAMDSVDSGSNEERQTQSLVRSEEDRKNQRQQKNSEKSMPLTLVLCAAQCHTYSPRGEGKWSGANRHGTTRYSSCVYTSTLVFYFCLYSHPLTASSTYKLRPKV